MAAARIEHTFYGRVFQVAREIAWERSYVGYIFFVLFALARRCRPFMWEGAERVNLLEMYAPWALESSAVADCTFSGFGAGV